VQRDCAKWKLTAAPERLDDRAFRDQRDRRWVIRDRRERAPRLVVVRPDLDRDDPLSGRGNADLDRDRRGDAGGE